MEIRSQRFSDRGTTDCELVDIFLRFPANHVPKEQSGKMSSNWWCDFVAGWLGGSAGIVVGHPADTVKVVQQVLMHDFRNINRKADLKVEQ